MPEIRFWGAAVALLIVAVSIPSGADVNRKEDRWPNFRCHPIYKTNKAWPGAVKANQEDWEWCLDDETKTGRCAKLCVMSGRVAQMIFQWAEKNDTSDPVVFDVSGFMSSMTYDNGYLAIGASGKAADAKTKVRAGLEKCKTKYEKEIAGWWMYMYDGCDSARWQPIFECIDSAIGCTSENTTPSSITKKPEQRRRPYQK